MWFVRVARRRPGCFSPRRLAAGLTQTHTHVQRVRCSLAPQVTRAAWDDSKPWVSYKAVPIDYFAVEKLALKGPRKNVDKGDPHDYGRSFVKE